jgi:hypothetical protein
MEGERPAEAMEQLLGFAVSQAEERGKSELKARWTEDGPAVIEDP